MGKGTNKLSAKSVEHAKPGKHMDGNGLHLVVTDSGNKKWKQRYTLGGSRKEIQLGSVPAVGLKEARKTRDKNIKRLAQGRLPVSYAKWQQKRKNKKSLVTFTRSAAQFIRAKRKGWKNKKHARQWVSTLQTYAKPEIGNKVVADITTEDILQILTPIWADKTETAKRVQTRIENVLDYAAAKGHKDQMNPARWRGHLDKLLMAPSDAKRAHRAKTGKTENHPAMPFEKVPAFMKELSTRNSVASLALQYLILTATRTREVLEARWDEIDDGLWTIPAERMKASKEHVIPLSPAALATIDRLPKIENNPYMFVGNKQGRPLSNMAMLTLMRKMGYSKTGRREHYVPHGFRSSFRDWAGEVSHYPRDVCEMALAHAIKDKTEAAYRRRTLLQKRCCMMCDWADYCRVK